jgi:hypothetical protein
MRGFTARLLRLPRRGAGAVADTSCFKSLHGSPLQRSPEGPWETDLTRVVYTVCSKILFSAAQGSLKTLSTNVRARLAQITLQSLKVLLPDLCNPISRLPVPEITNIINPDLVLKKQPD